MKNLIFLFLIIPFLGFSQISTKLKLRQLEQGTEGQVIVADSLGIAKWGVAGNGIYGGSDTIPEGTLAFIPDGSGNVAEFAIGNFPNWPDMNGNFTEKGFWYSPEYWGGTGLWYERAQVYLYNDEVNLAYGNNSRFYLSDKAMTGQVYTNYSNSNFGKTSLILNNVNTTCFRQFFQDSITPSSYYEQNVEVGLKTERPYLGLGEQTAFYVTKYLTGNNYGFSFLYIPTEDTTTSMTLYEKYQLPNAQPSQTASNKSVMTWTGVGGTSTTPAFTRFSNNVATGSTDGSGDLTITHLLPDATFSVTVTAEGTTPYALSVHTKGTSTFKVRVYNPTTGAAVTGTSVTLNWIAYDY